VDARLPTEVVEFDDLRQDINRELLPVDAFVLQGTTQPREPKFPSDKSLQGECVVAGDGKLLAFHLKGGASGTLESRTDWLRGLLDCSEKEAVRWDQAFADMNMNRTAIINFSKEDHLGIDDLECLISSLPEFESMKNLQDKATEYTSWVCNGGIEVSEYTKDNALQGELRKVFGEASDGFEFEPEEPGFETSCYGMHPLHYEEDGCSHAFLTFLRFASATEIRGIMKGFFPQKNQYGTKVRARFWYLTSSQRAQAWQYINDRRTRLGIMSQRFKLGSK
jgi:hypothetical protein